LKCEKCGKKLKRAWDYCPSCKIDELRSGPNTNDLVHASILEPEELILENQVIQKVVEKPPSEEVRKAPKRSLVVLFCTLIASLFSLWLIALWEYYPGEPVLGWAFLIITVVTIFLFWLSYLRRTPIIMIVAIAGWTIMAGILMFQGGIHYFRLYIVLFICYFLLVVIGYINQKTLNNSDKKEATDQKSPNNNQGNNGAVFSRKFLTGIISLFILMLFGIIFPFTLVSLLGLGDFIPSIYINHDSMSVKGFLTVGTIGSIMLVLLFARAGKQDINIKKIVLFILGFVIIRFFVEFIYFSYLAKQEMEMITLISNCIKVKGEMSVACSELLNYAKPNIFLAYGISLLITFIVALCFNRKNKKERNKWILVAIIAVMVAGLYNLIASESRNNIFNVFGSRYSYCTQSFNCVCNKDAGSLCLCWYIPGSNRAYNDDFPQPIPILCPNNDQ